MHFSYSRGTTPSSDLSDSFTKREWEIYQHLLVGKGNKEIAIAVGITVRTVRFHVTNILTKWNVTNRLELLAKYISRSEE